jgi:hypothetical protein
MSSLFGRASGTPNDHPKRPRNRYQLAKSIVDIATKEHPAYLPSGGSFDPRLAIIKGKPGH